MNDILYVHNETIFIGDPFFILTKQDGRAFSGTVQLGDFDYIFKEIGIERYLCDTSGDEDNKNWSVMQKKERRHLGRFKIESGFIAVVPLSEIFKYDPEFDDDTWQALGYVTIIPNFQGAVFFDWHSGKRRFETRVTGKGEKCFYSKVSF